MEENYREMYIHLHKYMQVLEHVLERLSDKVRFALGECAEIHLAQLEELADDKETIKKRFANLLDNL